MGYATAQQGAFDKRGSMGGSCLTCRPWRRQSDSRRRCCRDCDGPDRHIRSQHNTGSSRVDAGAAKSGADVTRAFGIVEAGGAGALPTIPTLAAAALPATAPAAALRVHRTMEAAAPAARSGSAPVAAEAVLLILPAPLAVPMVVPALPTNQAPIPAAPAPRGPAPAVGAGATVLTVPAVPTARKARAAVALILTPPTAPTRVAPRPARREPQGTAPVKAPVPTAPALILTLLLILPALVPAVPAPRGPAHAGGAGAMARKARAAAPGMSAPTPVTHLRNKMGQKPRPEPDSLEEAPATVVLAPAAPTAYYPRLIRASAYLLHRTRRMTTLRIRAIRKIRSRQSNKGKTYSA